MSQGMIIENLKSRIGEFFETYYEDEIQELQEEELDNEIELDHDLLCEFDQVIAEDLSNSPEQWMTNARAALEEYDNIEDPQILLKNYEHYNPAIRDLRDKHLNKLVKLDGVVSKATRVLHKADVAAFECRRCGHITKVEQPLDSDLDYPSVCSGEDCENRTERDFGIDPTLSKTINFRKIEVQEPPEDVSGGQTPETLTFTVKGEIADNITAGDNVTAIGIYKASDQGNTSVFRTYMKGNNIVPEDKEFEEIEITDEEIEQIEELAQDNDIYDKLRDSIAPALYGLENEKEAVLYQLFRGVRKSKMEGTTIRGDIHVLLVGDPSTGKSVGRDALLLNFDGNRMKISDFVEEHMDDPTLDEDGDLIDEVDDDVELLAMDKDGEIEPRQVEAVWKKNVEGNALRVELSDGRKITASNTHPLFTTDGNAHIKQVKTQDIEEEDFIAVPREIGYEGSYELEALHSYKTNENAVELSTPEQWTEELAELLGLIVSEGNVTSGTVSVTNEDEELLEVFETGVEHLGLNTTKRTVDKRSGAVEVSKSSVNLVNLLEEIDEHITNKSRGQRVPAPLFTAPEDIRKAFLRTYIDGEVHVDANDRREFNAGSMSEELLHDVQRLLDTFGIASQVKQRANESADEGVSYRLRVTGGSYEKYVEEIGFVSERKQERAEETMEEAGELHSNVDVVPDVADVIEETRKLLGMSQFDFSMPRTNIHGIEYEGKNPLRGTLQQIVEDMVDRLHMLRGFDEVAESDLTWSVVDEYRQFVSLSQKEVAEEMGITQKGYSYHTENNPSDGGQMVLEAYESIQEKVEEDLHQAHENLIRLESLAWGDIRWVKVDSVDEVAFDDEWMYDVQVEGVHNYVANGIMSHNSQLLRYASKLSPRGIQTSGKGSSAAGLCVGPSTEVMMNDESVEISEVVDDVVEDSVDRPVGVEVSDLETVGVDSDVGALSSDVRYLWRMPEQESVVLELDDGRELTVSRNTPLVTGYDDSGSYVWTDACDIESGVEVAVFDGDVDDMREVGWSRVVGVSETVSELYDMTTGVGNFYANGVVVHNTAAAVRDSEFGGDDKWTLQAGALVLADQGLACVDEIDKMSDSDRSSMHEGLEQQTISVAKAGINATLKSRCTLLAAANPKDGRWNEFDPVPAQIDLEPALVSRFDMIFAPVDERTDERDKALADHILTTNLRGQQIEAGMEPDEDTNNVEPEISPDLFKKYVAYARQHCNPVLTDEARKYIEDFFVDIRAEGEAEGAIPVTARKIEGIIRITEAIARIQLSDEARLEHAERAVNIVMESLKDVGFDEDEGRFDVDMTETNQSSSQRKRRNTLVEVIKELEDEGDKGAPKDMVIETMVEKHGFAKDEVDYDIAKMGREGEEIYEPRSGEFATM